jgi:cellulose synthase operon protein YhjU
MGLWSAYFLAKLLLYALGYMDFDPWMNLALAIVAALPTKNARHRFAKNLIAVPLGILLLYHDSWLPPIAQALAQAQNLRAFTASYLLELAGRLISWKLLLELAVMLAIYALARRKLRMSTFAFLGIVGVMVAPHAQFWAMAAPAQTAGAATSTASEPVNLGPAALDARMTQFYAEQKNIHIHFPRPTAEESPFDIVILHVCSLSWDDLRTLRLPPDAFFGHFDMVLSNFNSAASYSGPAAIRLLRGTCGQTVEAKLYNPAGEGCFVMDGLQNAGFEPHWAMNHDGHFGNFFGDVRDRGGLTAPLEDNTGATAAQQAFDGALALVGETSGESRRARRALLQHHQPARRQPRDRLRSHRLLLRRALRATQRRHRQIHGRSACLRTACGRCVHRRARRRARRRPPPDPGPAGDTDCRYSPRSGRNRSD